MKEFIVPLVGAVALLTGTTGPAAASDRYAERPPVMVSPDLSAPWVLQLGGRPESVRRSAVREAAPSRVR
ncbi:MAG: L,D-transpeptidase, partial [Mesorhizobium sp.]